MFSYLHNFLMVRDHQGFGDLGTFIFQNKKVPVTELDRFQIKETSGRSPKFGSSFPKYLGLPNDVFVPKQLMNS